MIWNCRAIADCESADLHRRGDVALNQSRRNAQCVGDIVKTFIGVVGWKQRRDVDLQVKQIANRVGVFGSVQAMQAGSSRVGICEAGTIESGFQFGCEGIEDSPFRTARPTRRHHPAANLANNLFPRLGALPDVGNVERIERQTARLCCLVVTRHAVLCQDSLRLRWRGSLRIAGEQAAEEPQRKIQVC